MHRLLCSAQLLVQCQREHATLRMHVLDVGSKVVLHRATAALEFTSKHTSPLSCNCFASQFFDLSCGYQICL